VPEQFIDMLRDKKAKEAALKLEREKEVTFIIFTIISGTTLEDEENDDWRSARRYECHLVSELESDY